ncbi:MAG TPA: glycosyltransferase [Actinophytocola sp.]|uniref:glycosyltransferase n=1 Tax=Actinophytocola sp. TaxID=1872138 RepID=UPI002DDCF52E|nr:glycosyltransferase [Actinophytocola sp.]HEV2779867.1 glycosyltransferase [Actinophytocola sp.]
MTDVVFTFSVEMFEDAVNREFCRPPDQTLLALARDERVGRLLVADSWRSYLASAARRRPIRLTEPLTVAGRDAVRVRPHRVRTVEATELATVERSYRAYGALLGRALARARGERRPRPESAALVTYHPFVAAFCDAPWIGPIVYFGQDDWATGEGVRPWWDLYREAYQRIDERKAAIFAVSDELAARISPRVTVVPNGVDPDVWRPRHPAPARIAALPGPRAIYTGTVDDRLERRLVEATAAAVGSVIMMGHPGDPDTIRWLRSLDNVHVFGSVGQAELAATVRACDVGLIPHRDQAGIRAMSPLKLYEYLAAGLPVVSVDTPPVHGVDDDRVVIVPRDDWAAGLAMAIALGRATEERRLRFLEEVSWQRRMRPVVDAATVSPLRN